MLRATVLAYATCVAAYTSSTACSDPYGGTEPDRSDAATPECSANLSADAKNCGACAHDCLGGTCSTGRCLPVLVASGQQKPEALAVDGTSIYWTNAGDGTVVAAPIGGGPPSNIAAAQGVPRSIASSSAGVVWTNQGEGTVRHYDPASRLLTTIAPSESEPFGVAVSAGTITWSNRGDGSIRVKIGDGSPRQIARSSDGVSAVATDATRVFWLATGTAPDYANGGVFTTLVTATDAGAGTTIAAVQGEPRGLASAKGSVFWTTFRGGTVMRAAADGAAVVRLAEGRQKPTGIAVDTDRVYWVEEYSGGGLYAVPIAGGTPTPLAIGLASPHAIAVDARAVYVANLGDGTIMKIAK